MTSLLGIFCIILIGYIFSRDKKNISPRIILSGLALQAALAFFILKTALGQQVFIYLGNAVEALISFADAGGKFAFGSLYELPEFIFAFKVTSAIVFVCALFAMFSYLGVLHPVLSFFSRILQKIIGASGAEVLAAIASALIGQVESALPLRPYFSKLSNSQFFAIMVGGMSTMSIALLAVYASFGLPIKYLLAANIMGIPAGLIMAKLFFPSGKEQTLQNLPEPEENEAHNIMDAIVRGAQDGFKISIAIIAVLIAIISIVKMVDAVFGLGQTSLANMFGLIFYPFALLIGTPLADAQVVGSLIGEKIALNEFIAYSHLAEIIKSTTPIISERAIMLSTFAICGFANFGSVAIQLGAFTEMLPARRKDFSAMGIPAMLAGALASLLSACWANLFF